MAVHVWRDFFRRLFPAERINRFRNTSRDMHTLCPETDAPPQSRDRARAEWTEAAQPPIAQAQGRDGDSLQVLQALAPDGSNGALLLAKQASTELHGGRRIDEQQELALPAPMLIRTITASRDLCGRPSPRLMSR